MAKVLVADDAAFQRHRYVQALTAHGFAVVEAENGAVAVSKYESERPDVVVLDITMPEMDGLEALKRIRQLDAGAKVVMCSALSQQSVLMEAIRAGAVDFIPKPCQPEKIVETIQRHIAAWR